jgi:anti-anti-sigma factor
MSSTIPSGAPTLESEALEGALLLRIKNAKILTEHSVNDMGERILQCLQNASDPPRILISFCDVQFLSSAGVGKLILIQRRIKERGGELVLCDMTPSTIDVFRVAHLQDYFRIFPDVTSALAAFS